MPHITTAEAKDHLHVEHAEEDSLVDTYVLAALEWLRGHTGRRIVETAGTVEYVDIAEVKKDATGRYVYLQTFDVQPATVTLESSNGAVDPGDFTVEVDEAGRARVKFVDGLDLGSNPLKFTYTAGYAEGSLPPDLKLAALFVVTSMYDNRGGGVIPQAAQSLADPFKVRIFAGA